MAYAQNVFTLTTAAYYFVMEELKRLTIAELREHLARQNVTSKTLKLLAENMVSGFALVLLDESELKKVVLIISDRAILRKTIQKLKQVNK